MAGASNTEEATLLDTRLDSISVWLGLSSTTPGDDGSTVTEPTTGGYARMEIDGTTGGWNAASGTAPVEKTNAAQISFAVATGDWLSQANLTHFVLYSAVTAGTMLYSGPLDVPKPVLNTDTAQFAIGDIRVQLGDPGDTFA